MLYRDAAGSAWRANSPVSPTLPTSWSGSLPEHIETEPNNTLDAGETVKTPVVVNGRINPKADMDCFGFEAKKGENLVVAIEAHGIDVHGQGSNYGIADFTLELLDSKGRVVAESLDRLGYDPLIEFNLPADGTYTARVKLVAYGGFPEAVYRLTIGQVPYITSVFPPGLTRGSTETIQLRGPNVPPNATARLSSDPNGTFPITFAGPLPAATSGRDLPVIEGKFPQSNEREPNNETKTATGLKLNSTVNAWFESADDVDWYRIRFENKDPVLLQIFAHRFVRSPVDTQLQVYDSAGKLLIENDDDGSTDPGYVSYHDFRTTDSCVSFRPPAAGEYFVRVSDNKGTFGDRAVYRLTMKPNAGVPDFRLRHYPDGVPIWGPGSTAGVLVRMDWLSYPNFDIELSVEGLPDGWKGSTSKALGLTKERPQNRYNRLVYLTITAPSDAVVGTTVPFRIVGRTSHEGKTIERVSYPLSLFYTSDTGFFRVTPVSRAAVAKARGPWLESMVDEVTITQGEDTTIPVRIHGAKPDLKEMPLVVNLGYSIKCNHGPPVTLPIKDGVCQVPLVQTSELPIGELFITVAQTWRSDIRIGMPGPCTRIIKLNVQPKK